MKQFIDYFSDDAIINYLCKLRVRYAKQRNQKHIIHLLSNNPKYNYHKNDDENFSEYEKELITQLNKILPSRRQWKDVGRDSRYKNVNGKSQRISSVDKNFDSLRKTVSFYRKRRPQEPFVNELNLFIEDIRNSLFDPYYQITSPVVYPKPKTKFPSKENVCRPIALFSLKDRLILSFTNSYLTKLFDPFFHPSSMAFRSLKIKTGGVELINHHTAIREIVNFKQKYFKDKPLWVAECDMKKFYDTVNHVVIVSCFRLFIQKAKEKHDLDFSIPERIFHSFLDSYSFNRDVLPFNVSGVNDDYWKRYKIKNGQFGWVEEELKELKFYGGMNYLHKSPNKVQRIWETIKSLYSGTPLIFDSRIGIPQGGALSGLIANMVLDKVDREIAETGTLYVRFCDDMILMDSDRNKCEAKVNLYKETLKELMLVPHEFSSNSSLIEKRKKVSTFLPEMSNKPFWKQKSKGPYKWDEVNNEGFPWVGFVGYEVHIKGCLRVRKSSLIKEKNKQKEVVNGVRKAIEKSLRAETGTVAKSTIQRLIGMSVGRINLWSYDDVESEMCWKNGFQQLDKNRYSTRQMKYLDRLRNRLYYKLVDDLDEVKAKREEVVKRSNSQIVGYNRPFSYYYQVADRSKSE